jgi:hypothetical protein
MPESTEPAEVPQGQWPPSQELLDRAVLQISDMPTGWAAVADDGEEASPPCDASISSITGVDEMPSGRAEFAEDEELGPLVILSVSVLPPDLGNLDVLGTLKQAILDCRTSVDGFDVAFSELSYPSVGDQSFAVRMSVTDDDVKITFEAVWARAEDTVIQVAGFDYFGDAIDIVDRFIEPQLERAVEMIG